MDNKDDLNELLARASEDDSQDNDTSGDSDFSVNNSVNDNNSQDDIDRIKSNSDFSGYFMKEID